MLSRLKWGLSSFKYLIILNAISPLSYNFLSAKTWVDRESNLYSSSSRSANTLINSILYGCFSRILRNNSAL